MSMAIERPRRNRWLLWLGLLANAFGAFTDLRAAVFGAVGGYMLLWLVYWGFRLLAKKEGMGYGDFKLLAAIGAWTGWQVLPVVVIVSAGAGAVIGGLLLWRSRSGSDMRYFTHAARADATSLRAARSRA